jgi:hypothetical protein
MMLVGQKNVVTCCNQELNVYEKKTLPMATKLNVATYNEIFNVKMN